MKLKSLGRNVGFCAVQSFVALLQCLSLQTSVRPTSKYGVYLNASLLSFVHSKPYPSDPSILNSAGNGWAPFIQASFIWRKRKVWFRLSALSWWKCLSAALQPWGHLNKLQSMVMIGIANEKMLLTKCISQLHIPSSVLVFSICFYLK